MRVFIQALTWNLVYGRKIARHSSEASENADCRGTQDHQPPYLSSPTRTIGSGSAAEPRRELTRIGYGWMWAKPSIGDTPWWGPVQFIFSRTAEGPWNAPRIFFQARFNMQRPNGHLSLPVLPVALRCKSGSRDHGLSGLSSAEFIVERFRLGWSPASKPEGGRRVEEWRRPVGGAAKFYLRTLAVIAPVRLAHTRVDGNSVASGYSIIQAANQLGTLKFSPLSRSTCVCAMYTERIYNLTPAAGRYDNRPHQRSPASTQPGLMLREISCCVLAGRQSGMEPVSSGPIPSWSLAPVGLVPRVICLRKVTKPSPYIKKRADQGSGVVEIGRKNDTDLIVGPMALVNRQPNAIQMQYNPRPGCTSIPRGIWLG